MKGRTVILVSHHVQLCTPGASFILALDNGHVTFAGDRDQFKSSGVMATLVQADDGGVKETEEQDAVEEAVIEQTPPESSESSEELTDAEPMSDTSSTAAAFTDVDAKSVEKKAPRKLIEEEKRAVGRIRKEIWLTYIDASGNWLYWVVFAVIAVLATLSPVLENGWLRSVQLGLCLHQYANLCFSESGQQLDRIQQQLRVQCITSVSMPSLLGLVSYIILRISLLGIMTPNRSYCQYIEMVCAL